MGSYNFILGENTWYQIFDDRI